MILACIQIFIKIGPYKNVLECFWHNLMKNLRLHNDEILEKFLKDYAQNKKYNFEI